MQSLDHSFGTLPAADERDDETGFSIPEGIQILRKRTKLIVAVIVAITLLSATIVFMLPNQYTAVSTVMVESREKTVTDVGRVVDGIRVDTPAIESEVEIVASTAVALRVIDSLDLRHDPEFGGIASSSHNAPQVQGSLRGKPVSTAPRRDYVLAAFQASMNVRRVRNSHVIEISFTAGSASKAAAIANAVANSYIAYELDQKIKQSQTATNFLKTKLAGLRSKVAIGEQAVERFKAKNNLFDSDGRPLSEKRLTRLMEQTIIARNNTAETRARHEQLNRMMREGKPKGAIADVLKSHTVRMLKDQQARVARRAAELAIRYGRRHPAMRKSRAELHDIQLQVEREVDQILVNLKNEYDVAVAREAKLGANMAALLQQQGELGQISVKLKELEREANTSRLLYEAILSRYKQTAETQSMQLPDSRVVETAAVPLQPSAPKRKKTVIISFFGAIAAAIGLALALEFLQSGALGKETKRRPLDLQQVAALPRLSPMGAPADDPLRSIRMILAEPHGDFAQAMRGIALTIDERRAAFQFGGAGELQIPREQAAEKQAAQKQGATIVLLASALPGEGRSIIASNLAHLYAMGGHRTLLIDADLRKSGLTALLAPSPHVGLHDCLGAGVPAQVAILRDAKSGLHFLPARGRNPQQVHAAAALASARTANTLTQLRKSFDRIIIDAPPLLPVVDGRILAGHADQVLFVMSWHRTPKDLALRAVRSLDQNADKVIGVVANRVEPLQCAHDSGLGSSGGPMPPHTLSPPPFNRAA